MMKPTISLFLICLVVTAALAFTYVGTKDTIAQRDADNAKQARTEVLPGADSFEQISVESIIASKPELGIIKDVYEGKNNGKSEGYVFTAASKGYGGDIIINVGINTSGKVTGVKIGDNKETPGLGSKAKDEPFIGQFKDLETDKPLKVVKGGKKNPEEIDSISGATITSRAVTKAVQAAIDMSRELIGKEGVSK